LCFADLAVFELIRSGEATTVRQMGKLVGWRAKDGPRKDDADSPFVPKGLVRAYTAEFNDEGQTFNDHDNPKFITLNRRLQGYGDPNTTRRLYGTGERQLYVDKDFSFNGVKLGINPFSVSEGVLHI